MKEWIADNWDKLAGLVLTVGGTLLLIYRRFIRMETRIEQVERRLDEHIEEDDQLRTRLDHVLERVEAQNGELRATLAAATATLEATRDDVLEIRADVRALMRGRD